MLSRAFTKPKRSPKQGLEEDNGKSESTIFYEYEDCIVGFMDDLPLVVINGGGWRDPPSLREILRGSAGWMGESCLGMTEKIVFVGGKICIAKRFRQVKLRRAEFGRRVARMASVSRKCDHLVPVTAYLYTKRLKFVLCDYYPMGSLADLLTGGRKFGHTALDWPQRVRILFDVARAIAFIHSISPSPERKMHMNIHGNIKSSNVLINIDFTARLSDYGFLQLARLVEFSDRTPPHQEQPNDSYGYSTELSQSGDVYNFGVLVMDILGGLEATKEEIRDGSFGFFDFVVDGKERVQALQVLEIGLACMNGVAEERPSIEQIVLNLGVLCKDKDIV